MLTEITLVGDPSASLVAGLAKRLDARLVTANPMTFPDGESKVTLVGRPAGQCLVVQSTPPPVALNLVNVACMVHAAAQTSEYVTAVIPYLGYTRQDREFLPGEVVSTAAVASILAGVGAKKVVTVDIHSSHALEHFGAAGRNVSAAPALAAHLGEMDIPDPLVISPDQGGQARARSLADVIHSDSFALKKFRNRRTGRPSILSGDIDVAGRNIILADDMISTGGSIIKATRFLKAKGCGDIYVACTHALMVGDAARSIRRAGVKEIISTNTIPGDTSVVDVSETLAAVLP